MSEAGEATAAPPAPPPPLPAAAPSITTAAALPQAPAEAAPPRTPRPRARRAAVLPGLGPGRPGLGQPPVGTCGPGHRGPLPLRPPWAARTRRRKFSVSQAGRIGCSGLGPAAEHVTPAACLGGTGSGSRDVGSPHPLGAGGRPSRRRCRTKARRSRLPERSGFASWGS